MVLIYIEFSFSLCNATILLLENNILIERKKKMVKKLAHSIREYKKASILTPVFVVFEVLLEIVIPMIMAVMIDKGISQQNSTLLAQWGFILIVCVVLGMICGVLSGGLCAKASAGFAQNLRQDMYYKIQGYSFANIDKFSTSSIVTRLTTDVTNVQNAYMMIIRVAVRAPIMLIFSLIASCMISTQLSFIFLIAVPILGIGLYFIVSRSHPYFEKVFHIYDELNSVVQENLTGIRVVKSFVRENFEIKKFRRVSKRIYQTFTTAEGIVAYNMPLMQFAVYGCLLFFLLVRCKNNCSYTRNNNDNWRIIKPHCLCYEYFELSYDVITGTCNDKHGKSFF